MTVDLSPLKVVLQAFFVGVEHDSRVEHWDFFQGRADVLRPVEYVGRAEG